MYIIVGLGNPTKKYEHTRHNAGFDCIDILAAKLNIKVNRAWCRALVGKGTIGSEKIVLAKPQTFMNLSGQSVKALLNFYKTDPAHLIVIYDDTDIEPGTIRIRRSGSAGGHNGMKDIIAMTGTGEFTRIRVGIGKRPEYMDMVDYVLGRAEGEDKKKMTLALADAAEAAVTIIEEGADRAMNKFN